MARYAEFQDSAGRHYVEHDMPEETAYKHPIRSYGDARRLSVYDPKDPTPRAVDPQGGGVRENPKGEPGLVGYSDFYREPPRSSGISFTKTDEKGNEIKSTPSVIADTNIGYMRVHEKYKGGGIGRQMFDYMHKTTPEGSILNVGKAASNETLHMSEKLKKEKPDSIKYKLF